MIDGTIRAAAANANIRLALKNCAPFAKCNLEINDEHVDTAENLDITTSKVLQSIDHETVTIETHY